MSVLRRFRLIIVALVTISIYASLAVVEPASAQDPSGGAPVTPAPVQPQSTTQGGTEVFIDNGYTVWRNSVGEVACTYGDHNLTVDVDQDPRRLSDVSVAMANYDVDYLDPQDCEGGSEVDYATFNGIEVGELAGANESWSINSYALNPTQVLSGTNRLQVDTDATGTGCWCVAVGYVEVRARVGFEVVSHTPAADEKNRDFHAGSVDLTVTFSTYFDPATLNQETVRLAYRGTDGSLHAVPGQFGSVSLTTFEFVPDEDLKDGVQYFVIISGGDSGVKSLAGEPLDDDYLWTFWTVPNLAVSNAFDYGDGNGSRCAPSASPCQGLELNVYQVARNARLVRNKPAVARLYVRWRQHPDVDLDGQVKELEADVELELDGSFNTTETFKRPDRYTASEIARADHTLNVPFTPQNASDFSVTVTPKPQSNAVPLAFGASRSLETSSRQPSFNFDYYVLRDGLFKSFVPSDAKAEGLGLMTLGSQLVTDMFPVLNTSFTPLGEFTIGYTVTDNWIENGHCGPVREVICPNFGTTTEWACIASHMETMRGGKPFIAATGPGNLCLGAMAFAPGRTFIHQAQLGANTSVVPHEIAHTYGLSRANDPTEQHRNDPVGVEGFQPRTMTNRSRVENPAQAESLMRTTQGRTPHDKWIHNDDYDDLLSDVSALATQAVSAGPALIVTGLVNAAGTNVTLGPAFLQELPNDPPAAEGSCTVALLDGSGTVLGSAGFAPVSEIEVYGEEIAAAPTPGPRPFSVSVPWNNVARRLRISCGGNNLETVNRTAAAPTVDFDNLPNGTEVTGSKFVRWIGQDADGPSLFYQLQFSSDGGATWQLLTPLMQQTSFSWDTTGLPSGSDHKLRIMVTDGFNTAFAVRTVTITNPLRVVSTIPERDATGVALNTTAQVLFATAVATPSLEAGGFRFLRSGSYPVSGTLAVSPDGRMVTFTPDEPLQPDSSYAIQLAPAVRDVAGNERGTIFYASFRTVSDTIAPLVVRTSPADGDLNVPLDAIVQIEFDERLHYETVTDQNFRLFDASNRPVPGRVDAYDGYRRVRFRPEEPLQPKSRYTARVTTGVTDENRTPMEQPYEWHFTTGADAYPRDVRITGNFAEETTDEDGDGLFDRLTIFVEVETSGSGRHNLNGRLVDKDGALIGWATTGDVSLDVGVHRLALVFDADVIRTHGVNGPYILDALTFYEALLSGIYSDPEDADVRYRAYRTLAYDVADFSGVLALKPLPDRTIEWNTTRENAWNLRDYTLHATRPVNEVTYTIISDTNPAAGVTIDGDFNVDIRPQPNREAESDVTVEARDTAGNVAYGSFHVSVQRPRASSLVLPAGSMSVPAGGTRTIEVEIHDQWGRLLTGVTSDVRFSTSLPGSSVSPPSVITTDGRASTTYHAPAQPGRDVLTIKVGKLDRRITIDVRDPSDFNTVYLPMVGRR